jgi:hypothetical protein
MANNIERKVPEADHPRVEKIVNLIFELNVQPEPRRKRPP